MNLLHKAMVAAVALGALAIASPALAHDHHWHHHHDWHHHYGYYPYHDRVIVYDTPYYYAPYPRYYYPEPTYGVSVAFGGHHYRHYHHHW